MAPRVHSRLPRNAGVSTYVVAFPKTQDAVTNPELWNEQWEKFYRMRNYPSPIQFVRGYGGIRNPNARLDFFFFSDLLDSTRQLHGHVMLFLRDQDFVDHFAAQWIEKDPQERKRHALTALANICGSTDNLNNARGYCPEILSMDNLALKDDGRGFLRLMDIVQDTDISKHATHEVLTYSPQWDTFLANWKTSKHTEFDQLCCAEVVGLRFKLLCWVTMYTMWSSMGMPFPKINVVKERYPKGNEAAGQQLRDIERIERCTIEQELKPTLGKKAAEARARDYEREHRKMLSERRVACGRCARLEPDGGPRHKRCERCWTKQERDISYCSRECQLADWRSGRHKVICGKPMDLQAAQIYAAMTRPRVNEIPPEDITEDDADDLAFIYETLLRNNFKGTSVERPVPTV
ncbi:hypothetical protein BD626DRAFT_483287 [Schizophyllum amplum]|uniref:MYND-type domain-containing protein n=1 Tax=Schizophyllum amplum TaxID=97359 RepID=A0A550CPC0_9AGAR|nr:hypothetical protein BD626DRAFT_483287 [Auriculariopsis ampla]